MKQLLNYLFIFIILTTSLLTFTLSYAKYHVSKTLPANALYGYRIYLDPGHGGKDNGASSHQVLEDEINLAITFCLLEQLLDWGATVEISRTGDYDLASLYASNRKREDLKRRAEAINKFNPDLFLSIHVNSYANSSVFGAQAFYRQNDPKSQHASTLIQAELDALNNTQKSAKPADFYFFNHLRHNGVLIECGFITNSNDRKKLQDKSYQTKLATTIINALYQLFYS